MNVCVWKRPFCQFWCCDALIMWHMQWHWLKATSKGSFLPPRQYPQGISAPHSARERHLSDGPCNKAYCITSSSLWSDVTALVHCFKHLHASVAREEPVNVAKYDDYAKRMEKWVGGNKRFSLYTHENMYICINQSKQYIVSNYTL